MTHIRVLLPAAALLAVAGAGLLTAGLHRDPPPQPAIGATPESGSARPGSPDHPEVMDAVDGPTGPQRTVPDPLPRAEPVRLDIPAIGVSSAVVPVGLRPDGTVQVPPLGAHSPVGWYRYLATPGETGPAVLLGHVDSARDGPAVFYRLGALRPGAPISVTRADGSTATFAVASVVRYPKTAFPSTAVYGPTGRPALRLITCGGDFDRATGSYRDDVVVFADLVTATPAPAPAAFADRPRAGTVK